MGGSWTPVIIAGLAALTTGLIGGLLTDIGPWYKALIKPSWQPPNWLFGPVWATIFALTALSIASAWHHAPTDKERAWMIGLFALNACLNLLWSTLFFRAKRPDWALIEVVVLWLSVLGLIVTVGPFSTTAALLLLPYLVWVAFAAFLNWTIVRLNPAFG